MERRERAKSSKALEKLPPSIQNFIQHSLPKFRSLNDGLIAPVDYAKLIREYTGWAYSCANRNAAALANCPQRLYRGIPRSGRGKLRNKVVTRQISKATKDRFFDTPAFIPYMNKAVDVEEVLIHPWLTLMREVNRSLNGFTLRQITMLFKQVCGNAYWLLAINPLTKIPDEIWVIPSQYVRIIPDEKRYIKAYQYGFEEPTENFPPENIVHFKCPGLRSIYYGQGPMESSYIAVTLNADFDEFERAILDNGAVIPFVLGTEQQLNRESLKRERKELERVHKGFAKAGKFTILHSGLKPLPLAWKPSDINYEKGLSETMKKIFGIFGVPLAKVTESSNRAHAEAANYTYMKDTIQPELIAEADQINQDIMPLYDEKLFVAPDDCVPEDKEYLLKLHNARLSSGTMTINEIRQLDRLEPVEGGNVPLVPKNLRPLNLIAEMTMPEPTKLPDGVDTGTGDNAGEQESEPTKTGPLPDIQRKLDDEFLQNLYSKSLADSSSAKVVLEIESAMEKAAASWFNSTQAIAAPYINEFTISNINAIDQSIPWGEIEAVGRATMGPHISNTLIVGAATIAPEVGELGWSQTARIIEWSRDVIARDITAITEETRLAVTETVQRALSEGKAYTKIAKDVRQHIGLNARQSKSLRDFVSGPQKPTVEQIQNLYRDKIRQRANMIARTETSRAFNEGNIEGYRQRGVQYLRMDPAADACEVCMGAASSNAKVSIGATGGVLPIHPNCGCNWVPVV